MLLWCLLVLVVSLAGLFFYGGSDLVRDPMGHVLPGCEKPVCDNGTTTNTTALSFASSTPTCCSRSPFCPPCLSVCLSVCLCRQC